MSEWLRRQTWNLLGFARAGSNPAVDVFYFYFIQFSVWELRKKRRKIFLFFFLRNKHKLFLFARETFSATKQILNSDGRQNSDRDNEP